MIYDIKHAATLKSLLQKGWVNHPPLAPNQGPLANHKATLKDLLQKGRANRPALAHNHPPIANQQPHELYVNEPGLYGLIFRSKLPNALLAHVRRKHKTTLEDLLQKGRPDWPPLAPNRPPLANQQPHELYVNEPGLYGLISRSISSN